MTVRASLLAATGAAILLAGCGGAREAANTSATDSTPTNTIVTRTPDATVTQDATGNTTIVSDQGTGHMRTGTPTGAMPGGLPAYPNMQAGGGDVGGTSEGGSTGRIVTFSTADSPAQIITFYAQAAEQAGFQILSRTDTGPAGALTLMRGSEAYAITAQRGAATQGPTQVQIAGGTN